MSRAVLPTLILLAGCAHTVDLSEPTDPIGELVEPDGPCLELDRTSIDFGVHRWTPRDRIVGAIEVHNVCDRPATFVAETDGDLYVTAQSQVLESGETRTLSVLWIADDGRSATVRETLTLSRDDATAETHLVDLTGDIDVGYVSFPWLIT